MPIGLYVHVPFCASKCGYCDFFSLPDLEQMGQYVETVIQEIYYYKEEGLTADTLFFGGGTPSLLPATAIGRIVDACREAFSLDGEITLEANPDSVSPGFLGEIRRAGVNRISFGAQSGLDAELQALGRRHNAADIVKAVTWAREAGFQNLSLDFMLGIPHQNPDTLQTTLNFARWLNPEHLSCYLLKIEEGTPFYNRMEPLCANGDEAASLYLQTCAALTGSDFVHYEISNFSKPGFQCRHNLKYWNCEEYLGFGPAAHSFYKGERFFHSNDLTDYILSGGANREPDGKGGAVTERLMLALRLTKGVSRQQLDEWGISQRWINRCEKYRRAGMIRFTGDRISLSGIGFLISNQILADLLEW